METEHTDVVEKPDRPPDHVAPAGHALWWDEMVFMHVFYGMFKIHINQEDGSFYYVYQGKRGRLGSAREKYDEWWYDVFESKVIVGENDG